jgi:hypothetical protein
LDRIIDDTGCPNHFAAGWLDIQLSANESKFKGVLFLDGNNAARAALPWHYSVSFCFLVLLAMAHYLYLQFWDFLHFLYFFKAWVRKHKVCGSWVEG